MEPRFDPVPVTFSNHLDISIACTKQTILTCFNQSPGDKIYILTYIVILF